jgi:CDP-diacylglycerol--serine O-phosphatidyltransferase
VKATRAKNNGKKLLRDAQKRAQRIVAQAQERARRVRERTRREAKRVGNRTIETVVYVHEQATDATRRAARLFRINLANTLTLLNGVFGFLAILAAVEREFLLAALFVLAGVLCDWLDGKAARYFSETTELGRELDSLSDLVTFGVAPAVIVSMIEPSFFSFGAGALFVLSAALRLGRFNVQKEKGLFVGVPTTTNGILLPALIFLGAPHAWFPWYLLLVALLMNAPIKIKKVV